MKTSSACCGKPINILNRNSKNKSYPSVIICLIKRVPALHFLLLFEIRERKECNKNETEKFQGHIVCR